MDERNPAKDTVDHLRRAAVLLDEMHAIMARDARVRQRRFFILGIIIGVLLLVIFRHHPNLWR